MGTDRGRYGSAAVSVRENRRKTSLLQSRRCVLLASADTRRVAIPTDHREPTSTTRHTAVSHAVSFCAAVWKRNVSHSHGTNLDWSETCRLRVRPYQRQHYDWRAENLQWVTPEENRKRAVILRARRMVARQDNDPSKDPKNMSSEELLQLFNMYNVAGDVYAGE